MSFYDDEQWVNWVDQLADDHFVVIDEFLPESLFKELKSYFNSIEEENVLKKAGIGALDDFQIKKEIRGDFIYWLEPEKDTRSQTFFHLMDELKEKLNRLCYLNISGYEFHLAKYPEGSFYKKHLDQFKERSNRLISVVSYLNDSWEKGDGGELIIHNKDDINVIEPIASRTVIFKSDRVEHEVALTHKTRKSLTGWLLYYPNDMGQLLGRNR